MNKIYPLLIAFCLTHLSYASPSLHQEEPFNEDSLVTQFYTLGQEEKNKEALEVALKISSHPQLKTTTLSNILGTLESFIQEEQHQSIVVSILKNLIHGVQSYNVLDKISLLLTSINDTENLYHTYSCMIKNQHTRSYNKVIAAQKMAQLNISHEQKQDIISLLLPAAKNMPFYQIEELATKVMPALECKPFHLEDLYINSINNKSLERFQRLELLVSLIALNPNLFFDERLHITDIKSEQIWWFKHNFQKLPRENAHFFIKNMNTPLNFRLALIHNLITSYNEQPFSPEDEDLITKAYEDLSTASLNPLDRLELAKYLEKKGIKYKANAAAILRPLTNPTPLDHDFIYARRAKDLLQSFDLVKPETVKERFQASPLFCVHIGFHEGLPEDGLMQPGPHEIGTYFSLNTPFAQTSLMPFLDRAPFILISPLDEDKISNILGFHSSEVLIGGPLKISSRDIIVAHKDAPIPAHYKDNQIVYYEEKTLEKRNMKAYDVLKEKGAFVARMQLADNGYWDNHTFMIAQHHDQQVNINAETLYSHIMEKIPGIPYSCPAAAYELFKPIGIGFFDRLKKNKGNPQYKKDCIEWVQTLTHLSPSSKAAILKCLESRYPSLNP